MYIHDFGKSTNGHRKVHRGVLINVDSDVVLPLSLKSRRACRYDVIRRRKLSNDVSPTGITGGAKFETFSSIGRLDLRAREDSAGRVFYGTGNRAGIELGVSCGEAQQSANCENRSEQALDWALKSRLQMVPRIGIHFHTTLRVRVGFERGRWWRQEMRPIPSIKTFHYLGLLTFLRTVVKTNLLVTPCIDEPRPERPA